MDKENEKPTESEKGFTLPPQGNHETNPFQEQLQDTQDGEWLIVELLGHIRMAGYVTEEEKFGGKLGRIDIPNGDGFITQYFGHSAIFRVTPTTEEVARSVAKMNQPRPVHHFELPERVTVEGTGEPSTATQLGYDWGQDEDYDF